MRNRPHLHSTAPCRPAFTLMELMVSVAILVLIILSVGVMFQSASRSVGLSQATSEMLSNQRAVEQQIADDIKGIDKNGFITIRCKKDAATGRRFDQIAFISIGNFPNRTGTSSTATPPPNPFADRLTANAALVWYGQLAIQTATTPLPPGNYLSSAQNTQIPLNTLPSGVNDTDFILGRHTTLLVASSGDPSPGLSANGTKYVAYATPQFNTPAVTAYPGEGTAANITCSRLDIATQTVGSLEQSISDALTAAGGRSGAPTYEIDNYCYRFACLRTPYDALPADVGTASPIVNAYFRMHPILLQGVPSFAIEWTDGTPDATYGLRWYGLNDANAPGVNPKNDATIEPAARSQGDDYQAIFSLDQKNKWPKALRFRYRLADPTGRFPTGREFVDVVALP